MSPRIAKWVSFSSGICGVLAALFIFLSGVVSFDQGRQLLGLWEAVLAGTNMALGLRNLELWRVIRGRT